MRYKIAEADWKKLISYFEGFYDYDDEGNEIAIDPLTFRDVDGDTALHIACRRGDLWAVELLVMGGVDVNAVGDMDMTPLHAAHRAKKISKSDREAIERYLIENGANTDFRDGFGLKPLQNEEENRSSRPTGRKWDCDKK